MMVTLPTNTVISIRQRSVEMVGNEHREAVVSFEMFAYPADNGGKVPRCDSVKDSSFFLKRPGIYIAPRL